MNARNDPDAAVRDLFQRAGAAMPVDTHAVKDRIAEAMAQPTCEGVAGRPDHRYVAAAAAVVLVAGGALGFSALLDGDRRPDPAMRTASATGMPSTGTTPSPSPTPTYPMTVSGGGVTVTRTDGSFPALTPGMPLPANQREITSRYRNEVIVGSQTTGLGKLHIKGAPANLVLIRAQMTANAGEPKYPGLCIKALPADASVNKLNPRGAEMCAGFPHYKGQGVVGDLQFAFPPNAYVAGNLGDVDEFRGKGYWFLVATTDDVARLDLRLSGKSVQLGTRIAIPELGQALFTAILPPEMVVGANDSSPQFNAYDINGKALPAF
jgi:hypothetical protein